MKGFFSKAFVAGLTKHTVQWGKDDKNNATFHHEHNIYEGGEFFDDAIRMKDQPLNISRGDGYESQTGIDNDKQ
jgi:hypothetical protein